MYSPSAWLDSTQSSYRARLAFMTRFFRLRPTRPIAIRLLWRHSILSRTVLISTIALIHCVAVAILGKTVQVWRFGSSAAKSRETDLQTFSSALWAASCQCCVRATFSHRQAKCASSPYHPEAPDHAVKYPTILWANISTPI